MKLSKILSTTVAIGALGFAASSFAVPISLDVGAVGSDGDQRYAQQLLGSTYVAGTNSSLGDDVDTTTGLFDTMTFGIASVDGLLDISAGTVDGLRLGSVLLGLGDNEGIGQVGDGVSLDISWVSGVLSFNFVDVDNSINVVVASGAITSSTQEAINVDIDISSLSAGFWLDQYGNDIASSNDQFMKVSLSVQAGGTTVDTQVVPEPSIIALLGFGLVGMGVATRRKQKAA